IRWGKFPLKIYIEPAPKGKNQYGFKPSYPDAVKAGIESWRVSSDTFLKFIYVKNPLAADVQISWVPKYTDRFAQANVVPERYRNYAVPKANPAYALLTVAAMLTPGYFRLAPQLVGSALQMRRMHQLQVIVDESKMQLGIQDLENRPESEALVLLQNRTAHEFGHVLGLKGHSPDEKDLMYTELKTQPGVKPSVKDWNTLMNLYQRPANLVLNVH
ncbi:MAG: matrixin family metalloprotease, partial [Cyanobacteria bacterium]|nr:matrixin family metalloprotease [Cyanobacteriota bacterium]